MEDFFQYEVEASGLLQITTICLGCVGAICIYGKYRSDNPDYHDPLMRKIGVGDLDGWSLTHAVFYTVCGYCYPKYWWYTSLGGLTWEIFEHWYGAARPGFLGGFGDFESNDPNVGDNWWHGRLSDPVLNSLGVISGMYLRRLTG